MACGDRPEMQQASPTSPITVGRVPLLSTEDMDGFDVFGNFYDTIHIDRSLTQKFGDKEAAPKLFTSLSTILVQGVIFIFSR